MERREKRREKWNTGPTDPGTFRSSTCIIIHCYLKSIQFHFCFETSPHSTFDSVRSGMSRFRQLRPPYKEVTGPCQEVATPIQGGRDPIAGPSDPGTFRSSTCRVTSLFRLLRPQYKEVATPYKEVTTPYMGVREVEHRPHGSWHVS